MLLSLNLTLFRVDLLLSFSLNLFLFLPLPDARILDLTLGLVLLGLGVLNVGLLVGFLVLGLFTTLLVGVGLGGLGLCVLIWGLLGLWVGGGAAVEVEEKNWGGGAGVVGRSISSISSISSMNVGLSWPLGRPRPPSNMDKRVELKVGEGVVTGGCLKAGGGSGLEVGNLLTPPKAPGSSF